jgi:hypothetical protein
LKVPTKAKRGALTSKPWEPFEFDEHVLAAFQQLAQGRADDPQQKLCLSWMLRACRVEEQSFVPNGDPHGRIDAFVEGKRAVGNQIWTLLRTNITEYLEQKALRRRGETKSDEQH